MQEAPTSVLRLEGEHGVPRAVVGTKGLMQAAQVLPNTPPASQEPPLWNCTEICFYHSAAFLHESQVRIATRNVMVLSVQILCCPKYWDIWPVVLVEH